MDNEVFVKIKKNLQTLPILEEQLAFTESRLSKEEEEARLLLDKYGKEFSDVERLKSDSLSATILRLSGLYKNKITKESNEMYNAKMVLDKSSGRIKELRADIGELTGRISELKIENDKYKEEYIRRSKILEDSVNGDSSIRYKRLRSEQDLLITGMAEIEEAIKAAGDVIDTSESAIGHLESAEGWATFDVWTRGGIFSHIAKYDHIDEAQDGSNRLNSQLKKLHKELADIKSTVDAGVYGIDSTTRTIDFWFDNIFTDLNVRDSIRDDMYKMITLRVKVHKIISKLETDRSDLKKRISELDVEISDMIAIA